MLENFTPEEIEQIKKELGLGERLNHKKYMLIDQTQRLEEMFPTEKYFVNGIRLCPAKDIREALTMIVDNLLNNYEHKDNKRTWSNGHPIERGPHYVRAVNVSNEMRDQYRKIFTEFVDLIEKYNVPWNKIKED